MRRFSFTVSFCVILVHLAIPALASESSPSAGAAKAASTRPQIITDEKTNTVRVVIGGKEVLTVDASGLHVNGNIEYTGMSRSNPSAELRRNTALLQDPDSHAATAGGGNGTKGTSGVTASPSSKP